MKFAEYLSKEQISKVNQLRQGISEETINQFIEEQQPTKMKIKETFTKQELEELMGIRKDTFRRVRGAIRRR